MIQQINPTTEYSEQINVKLSKELKTQATTMCEKTGISVNELIRELLRSSVENYTKTQVITFPLNVTNSHRNATSEEVARVVRDTLFGKGGEFENLKQLSFRLKHAAPTEMTEEEFAKLTLNQRKAYFAKMNDVLKVDFPKQGEA